MQKSLDSIDESRLLCLESLLGSPNKLMRIFIVIDIKINTLSILVRAELLAKPARGNALVFAEHAAKIRIVVVSANLGDIGQFIRSVGCYHRDRKIHALFGNHLLRRYSQLPAEQVAEIVGADTELLGY